MAWLIFMVKIVYKSLKNIKLQKNLLPEIEAISR